MSVNMTDSASEERVMVDEVQYFRIRGDACHGETRQRLQNDFTPAQVAEDTSPDLI
jgi:hypothetical protein